MSETTENRGPAESLAPDAPLVPLVAADPVVTPDQPRPWHGALNPFEAIFAHFTSEVAALRTEIMGLMGGSKADQKAASAAHTEATGSDAPVE